MALDIILLKTPYSVAFTGNPMPFVFALAPYGDTEKAQVILLQVRVLIEDTYGTGVFAEAHSQNIYPDNNGMVTLDVHTLLDPYLKWFLPKPTMAYGVIKEAAEQRKRYKLSYLLQQNSEVIGLTQETGLFLAVKGGLSYESWKPVDFFNQAEDGQPLHFPVSKNVVLKDQPLFFWWLMPDVPQSQCVPVTYTPVTLNPATEGQEYDDYVYFQGSSPIIISNFSGPSGMSYSSSDGTYIHLEGFPDTPGPNQTITFTLTNCSGVPVAFSQQINVAAAGQGGGGGGTVCNPVQMDKSVSSWSASQNAAFGFSIPYTGTAPVAIQSCTGDATGMLNDGFPKIISADDGESGVIRFEGVSDVAVSDYDFVLTVSNCAGATDTFNGSFLVTGSGSGSGGGSGGQIGVVYNDGGGASAHTTQRTLQCTWSLNGQVVHSGGISPGAIVPLKDTNTGIVFGNNYDIYMEADTDLIQVFITQSGGSGHKFIFSNGVSNGHFQTNGTGDITIQ